MKTKSVHYFVISAFTLLYVITSLISTIHVVDFFALSNPQWLAIGLAIAFEVGAAASLASIVALHKMNKAIVWGLFILLTAMQAMGNTYYAYVHLHQYQGWIELFGLVDDDPMYQKRILGLISGATLPVVALGFIKALVDYIKPVKEKANEPIETEEIEEPAEVIEIEPNAEPVIESVIESVIPVEIEPAQVEEVKPAEQNQTTEPLSTINNTDSEKPIESPSIDDAVARGIYKDTINLKKPHDV